MSSTVINFSLNGVKIPVNSITWSVPKGKIGSDGYQAPMLQYVLTNGKTVYVRDVSISLSGKNVVIASRFDKYLIERE